MDSIQYNWLHIKEEVSEPLPALYSPPTTPSSFTFSSSPSLPPSRTFSPPTSERVRPRPYPSTKPSLKRDSDSLSHPYLADMWNSMRGRSVSTTGQRTSDDERQAVYSNNMNDPFMMPANQGSSLLGAMGTAPTGAYGRAPALYPHNMEWNPGMPMVPTPSDASYPTGMPGHSGVFSSVPALGYGDMEAMRNGSPESIGSRSPPYGPPSNLSPYYVPPSPSSGSQSPPYSQASESELRRLQKRVRDLERALNAAQSSTSTLSAVSPAFQESWDRRTQVRTKIFCSLNRAGNALCAWHDSRRERRQYPPRNAPPGMLNCGCTHEEALFEESLSRHKVGGYMPGENVRMDPELRRPLLQLLQKRYGYKDGDFDRDAQTGEWNRDQDLSSWERQAQLGSSARARRPDQTERH